MNNDELKLSYYQSMIFIYELNKMKRNNKYFNDPISDSFELYMLNKTKELVLNYHK